MQKKCKRFFTALLSSVLVLSLSVPVSATELASKEMKVDESVNEEVVTKKADVVEVSPESMENEILTDVSGNEVSEIELEQAVEDEFPLDKAGETNSMINFGEFYEGTLSHSSYHGKEQEHYYFTMESSGKVKLDFLTQNSTGYSVLVYQLTAGHYYEFLDGVCYNELEHEIDLKPGTYTIRLDVNGPDANYCFKVSLVNTVNETVPETVEGQNDKISGASAIATGSEIIGQIAYTEKTDFYKFTLDESGRVAINLNAEIQELSYFIYNDEGSCLTTKNAAWNQTTEMINLNSFEDLVEGDYYIEIRKRSNYTGEYAFTLIPSNAGESFKESQSSNDNTLKLANDIAETTLYTGQLALNDDRDWYKISVGNNAKLIIDFNSSTMSAVNLVVYDVNGNEMIKYSPAAKEGILAFSKAVEILNGGIYYVGIVRYADDFGYTGPYSFKTNIHYHTYTTTMTPATLSKDGSVITQCTCGTIANREIINRPWSIILSEDAYAYNGKAKKPSVVVKDVYGNVISSDNYTVTYSSGRKNVGKYTATVIFKGNYSGSKNLSFIINPKKTKITKLSASSKGFTIKYKKAGKLISGYQVQYSTRSNFKGARIKNVSKSKTSQKIKGLKAKKTYYVRVRTYKTVKGKKYYSDWSSVKRVTTKK